MLPEFQDKISAILDGSAVSCIFGEHVRVISFTGKYAYLVGCDTKAARTDRVLIVSAYIKAKSSTIRKCPVFLKIHEAPYNPNSHITLLSKHKIQEYGLIINLVAKKHKDFSDKYGSQCSHLNQ